MKFIARVVLAPGYVRKGVKGITKASGPESVWVKGLGYGAKPIMENMLENKKKMQWKLD